MGLEAVKLGGKDGRVPVLEVVLAARITALAADERQSAAQRARSSSKRRRRAGGKVGDVRAGGAGGGVALGEEETCTKAVAADTLGAL